MYYIGLVYGVIDRSEKEVRGSLRVEMEEMEEMEEVDGSGYLCLEKRGASW